MAEALPTTVEITQRKLDDCDAKIRQLRSELHGSWGKPVDFVTSREQEIQTLLRSRRALRAALTRAGETYDDAT